ncbi:MAG: hypothetical protein AAGD35_13075 [Actinomycetota bacterium]
MVERNDDGRGAVRRGARMVCTGRAAGPRRRILPVVLVAALAIACTGCLRLPDETTSTTVTANPVVAAADPDQLRALLTVADLGLCDETGWSGAVVSTATADVAATVDVVFLGLGSEELGRGSTAIVIEADGRADFTVVPEPAIDDLVLTCSIELTDLGPA